MAEANALDVRVLEPQWNGTLIAASIATSLLGAFTSTQLMCQARTSRHFTGVLVWTALGSLTFGFCSIWSLHEVAMLAYGLDLRIGIDVGLTILSACLAVVFTFFALATHTVWHRCFGTNEKSSRRKSHAAPEMVDTRNASAAEDGSLEPLLPVDSQITDFAHTDRQDPSSHGVSLPMDAQQRPSLAIRHDSGINPASETPDVISPSFDGANGSTHQEPRLANIKDTNPVEISITQHARNMDLQNQDNDTEGDTESLGDSSSRRSSSFGASTNSALGLGGLTSIKRFRGRSDLPSNPFAAMYKTLVAGLSVINLLKAFCWAIAITSMHYVGLRGLRVPEGFVSFNPYLVILSFLICWIVCIIGCILILEIETHLGQQLLFSVVAASGVAAMHFTGMAAATFYSHSEPTDDRGYPPGLATAIAAVAISTCLGANLLLAHSATISRNKLAEIVWTRRKLWMAIAQKDSAETAAAARSEFIANASHEIRTPLHHLQGYSDLLSRTELTEEGRLLLLAIQRATKTLSLITNNVLDWSRLEQDTEATCRPVSLDLRTICESIVTLLPNQDEGDNVDLMVVVSPNVPHEVFIDETYIHRILMNLLSNALKFTTSGYILLAIQMEDGKLVASVTDTGPGVPPDFLPQLFEPFKQAQVRGRARGTGLGLSIIKQLLHNMQGSIDVVSEFQDTEGVGPAKSGSTFTIQIPVQQPLRASQDVSSFPIDPRVTILHGGNARALEGLELAWKRFGYTTTVVDSASDLSSVNTPYIWVDLPSLQKHPQLLATLTPHRSSKVLIPYDSQSSLLATIGSPTHTLPPHIVPISKSLIWHTFQKQIDLAVQQKSNPARAVRFDPVVKEHSHGALQSESAVKTPLGPAVSRGRLVLLVEDNPINCKLGQKMLQSLGYDVLVAEDGVYALDMITTHDASIDAVLMDQSMPRKDGLTATREIRALESQGVLTRKGRPIIAVSAVVSSEAQKLFKEAGADDFLAKPLSLDRLSAALDMYL